VPHGHWKTTTFAAGLRIPAPAVPPPLTSYHMNSGLYEGRDPRDVADEAISWLEQQIAIAET